VGDAITRWNMGERREEDDLLSPSVAWTNAVISIMLRSHQKQIEISDNGMGRQANNQQSVMASMA